MICPNEISAPNASTEALTKHTFAKNGYLVQNFGLEYRKGQEEMAIRTAKAFEENSPLLFEGGTGIGKSLAYLIPGIIHSIEHKRPFLVSTHTITLQRQILNSDLNLCRKLFQTTTDLTKYRDFKASILVGKGNYLCPNRLHRALKDKAELFPSSNQDDLEKIYNWSLTTQTGLIEELQDRPSYEVWQWVNADSSSCNKKTCNSNNCFYRKAKSQIHQSDIIILNHSLLFSLIGAGFTPKDKPGILFPNDFLAIDEAHTAPNIATEYFGISVSSFSIQSTLKQLFNSKNKKGLISTLGDYVDFQAVTEALDATEYFFEYIKDTFLSGKNIIRIHEPNWTEPILLSPLAKVISRLNMLAQRSNNEALTEEINDQRQKIVSFKNNIEEFIKIQSEDHTYWLERTGIKGSIVHLKSAPIDVSEHLKDVFLKKETSILLTSATLETFGSMDYFKNQIGGHSIPEQKATSPFDYEKHMQVYIATDSPLPNLRTDTSRQNIEYLTDMIQFCTQNQETGTLVLFTNYFDMHQASLKLADFYIEQSISLLVQGKGISRSEIIERMKSEKNTVAFGTDSFWTGIDVPGKALSQVIITRLPFENPSHPIQEAKCEYIKKNNLNPFNDYIIPNSLIKFRQGVGRLIRNKWDTGRIVILDSRILTKSYGKYFIGSLPNKTYYKFCKNTRASIFQNQN